MTEAKRWTVDIHLDEHEDRTRARARLHNQDETGLDGVGLARLNAMPLAEDGRDLLHGRRDLRRRACGHQEVIETRELHANRRIGRLNGRLHRVEARASGIEVPQRVNLRVRGRGALARGGHHGILSPDNGIVQTHGYSRIRPDVGLTAKWDRGRRGRRNHAWQLRDAVDR